MGGFTTGQLKAGGPVEYWENEIMKAVTGSESLNPSIVREVLNTYFIEDGMETLIQLLESGKYEVSIPEEGALLKLAYYKGIEDYRAADLQETLTPYFQRVRFYPKPSEIVYELKEDFTIINLPTFVGAINEMRTPQRIVKLSMCIE